MSFKQETFDYTGIHRGVVLDNNDPRQLGRLKINVFGIYKNIPVASIPWAVPMFPVGFGSGVGYGIFTVPEVGSHVFVMFEGLDVNQPLYIGSAPDAVHGLPSERTNNYPRRRIIKSTSGIVIYVDDNEKEIKASHPSGAYIKIDASGNVVIQGSRVDINP